MANRLTTALSGLSRLAPRRLPERSTLLWGIYTFALFVVFLVLTFPHGLVIRRFTDGLASESGWTVRYGDVRLVPWDGYRFTDLKLAPPGDDEPWLVAPQASLRPTFSALVRGRPLPLAFRVQAYGGQFTGLFDRGESVNLDLSWDAIDLGTYPRTAKLLEGNWSGQFTGELHLTGKDALNTYEGQGHVEIKDASLTQGKAAGFTVPDLHFTRGEGDCELKAGRLELKTVKLAGSDADAELKGQIYLRAPLEQSLLNGTLTVKPVPGSPSGIEGVLTLLNRNQKPPGGVFTYQLYGTLSRVRIR